jgi:hypothetical protein
MAQYTDLYLRGKLGETGTMPRGASSSSPDIIPWGLTPKNDPQTFFSGNYGSDVGVPLTADATNCLYIRAKNLGTPTTSGDAFLYYAKSSLLLYPDQWKNQALKTNTGASSVRLENIGAGLIGVTKDAYNWVPSVPPDNYHYCLIGRITTAANPNPIPATGSITDFAAWVAQNGGIGWRNVSIVDAGSPTLTMQTVYDQGDTPGDISFTMTCNDCPVNQSWVQFSSSTPIPGGEIISIPKTLIDQQGKIIGVKRKVPANWKTTFNINYWTNAGPGPNWGLDLEGVLVVAAEQKELFELAMTHSELGWHKAVWFNEKGERETLEHTMKGPSRGIRFGEAVMRNGRGI